MKKQMIRHINIDPNGLCNAKCWYCPIAYVGNPKDNKKNMSIETMENILKQVTDGIGDFVFVGEERLVNNPIHYNEVLLYPYFEEMLQLHRKYNIEIFLFSNGVNLTKEKTDIIEKYSDIIHAIMLNIPSAEKNQWAEYTGFNPKLFDKLVENVNYSHKKLVNKIKNNDFSIMVNGINELSLTKNNGWITVLENAPEIDLDKDFGTHAKTLRSMGSVFPGISLVPRTNLSDRTNILSDLKIFSNQESIKIKNKGTVIGCGYEYPDSHLFISSVGNVFLCSADFNYQSVYGNILEKPLKDIWNSIERQEIIEKSYSNMCTSCLRAVWSDSTDGPSLQKGDSIN
jgi:radical SAM protein with 4Fe4S-binding SPASM domain